VLSYGIGHQEIIHLLLPATAMNVTPAITFPAATAMQLSISENSTGQALSGQSCNVGLL